MSQVHARETAAITAPASEIYAVLADYAGAHQRILPRPYFTDMIIEEGGQGAGTVFSTSVKVLGVTSRFRMAVTEPAPGRTLRETDLASGLVTTFEVNPSADGRQAQVTISSEWAGKPGIGGWIDRLSTPRIMRSLYRKELRNLQDYLDQRPARPA